MNNEKFDYLKEKLESLKGLQLYNIKRRPVNTSTLRISFSDETRITQKSGHVSLSGEHILFATCFYRFLVNGKLYLSRGDSLEYDSFRLLVKAIPYGGLDEYHYNYEQDMCINIDSRVKELLEFKDFIVNEVHLMETRDLKINFANGFSLEVFIDTQTKCWGYRKLNANELFIVTSKEIITKSRNKKL